MQCGLQVMENNRAVCILHISTPHGHEANIGHPVSGLNEVRAIMTKTIQITVLSNSGECAASIIRGQDRGSTFLQYIGICLLPTASHPSDCNIITYTICATVATLSSTVKRDLRLYMNDVGLIFFLSVNFQSISLCSCNWLKSDPLNLPAAAVPITGCPTRAAVTSHIPSLWPEYSRTKEQLTVGPLKLDTILLVWALSLCAVLIFWDPAPETAEQQVYVFVCFISSL